MKLIQRVIYCGFATVAIASASMPVFPASVSALHAGVFVGADLRQRDVPGDGATHPADCIERR